MKKNINYKVIQNQHIHTLVEKKFIWLAHCVCKMAFKCKKITRKVAKNTHLKLYLLLLKCFSITHNFLDWYENLATWTTLVCTTLSIFKIRNGHCIMKKQAAKVYCNPKMSGFWTLNCSQTFKTTWIYIKFFPQ